MSIRNWCGVNISLRGQARLRRTAISVSRWRGASRSSRRFRPHVAIGPFNQLQRICYDYGAVFGGDFDVIALLWRIEDLFADMLTHCLDTPDAVADLLRAVQSLADAVAALRKSF